MPTGLTDAIRQSQLASPSLSSTGADLVNFFNEMTRLMTGQNDDYSDGANDTYRTWKLENESVLGIVEDSKKCKEDIAAIKIDIDNLKKNQSQRVP